MSPVPVLLSSQFQEWNAPLTQSQNDVNIILNPSTTIRLPTMLQRDGFPGTPGITDPGYNSLSAIDYRLSAISFATYGRGAGVGRGLAVGADLGVGVGRGVDVGDAVAVAVAVGVGVGVGVPPPTAAKISTRPQPYTLFGGPASPQSVEAIWTAELFIASRLSVS
jgi:hypothetical protein